MTKKLLLTSTISLILADLADAGDFYGPVKTAGVGREV
jgi:hypothetical protein